MRFIVCTYLIIALIIGSMLYLGTDAERWNKQNEKGINELIQESNNGTA